MICEQVKDRTGGYLDGVMDDISQKAFEAHLIECSDCKSYVEETNHAIAWVKQASDVQPPQNLRQSVLKILHVEQKAKRHRRFKPGFMQAVAAAAVFLLLITGNVLPHKLTAKNFAATQRETILMEAGEQDDLVNPAAPPQDSVVEEPNRITSAESKTTEDKQNETAALLPEGTKEAVPYRLLLNIIGIPILIALILIGMKKRREALP